MTLRDYQMFGKIFWVCLSLLLLNQIYMWIRWDNQKSQSWENWKLWSLIKNSPKTGNEASDRKTEFRFIIWGIKKSHTQRNYNLNAFTVFTLFIPFVYIKRKWTKTRTKLRTWLNGHLPYSKKCPSMLNRLRVTQIHLSYQLSNPSVSAFDYESKSWKMKTLNNHKILPACRRKLKTYALIMSSCMRRLNFYKTIDQTVVTRCVSVASLNDYFKCTLDKCRRRSRS